MSKCGYQTLVLAGLVSAVASQLPADDKVDFARDIRPILSDACFQCHGPDQTQRKADLRLDTREGAFGERDGGVPLVTGKPPTTELSLPISSNHPPTFIPPPTPAQNLS